MGFPAWGREQHGPCLHSPCRQCSDGRWGDVAVLGAVGVSDLAATSYLPAELGRRGKEDEGAVM